MPKKSIGSHTPFGLPAHLILSSTIAIAITLCIALLYFVIPKMGITQSPINDIEARNGEYDFRSQAGEFYGKAIYSLFQSPMAHAGAPKVLGYPSQKRIEVDLSNQRLYAFEGENKVFDFLVSTGKFNRTPTGTFHIWIKLRYTKMEGGNKDLRTYYNLPNVPYTMFFANDEVPARRGFGIHGTYWHSNFGQPMSHGCINMKTEEAGMIYNWAEPTLPDGKKSVKVTDSNPGTPVIIYGVAPKK